MGQSFWPRIDCPTISLGACSSDILSFLVLSFISNKFELTRRVFRVRHLQWMPRGFDGREMLKLSVRMKDRSFEVETGHRVDTDLPVLIRRQEALSIKAAERGDVYTRVVR